MRIDRITLVILGLAAGLPCFAGTGMEDQFHCPPAGSRILPIQHRLPVAAAEQDAYYDTLQEGGFGGMATNVSFQDYLRSEENWNALKRGLDDAKRRGLSLWLYDERGYPSGNAGGLTMEGHPEWEARGLLFVYADGHDRGVKLECPPGALFRAAAYPVVERRLQIDSAVDLSGMVKDGKLVWDMPAGDWRLMVITEANLYEGTHAQVSLAEKLPYINLLMDEPTKRFLELTHSAYAAHLGEDLGKYFASTFTDEPSLMSLFMRPQPWTVIPWAPNLPGEFEKRRGYRLEPVVPLLVLGDGGDAEKTRCDFWRTVGELVSENFFGQIQDWCHAHNILSGGHLLMEESILTHVPLYGNFFQCVRRLDAPSMDCLTSIPREVPWQVGRLISSVADLEGRTVTMSESSDHSQRWRAEGDARPKYDVSEEEIRGSYNRLIVNGITTFTSYYSFKGLETSQLVRLNEWVGRCCTMLCGGHQIADVAVVYPAETMMARFAPARHWVTDSPRAARQVQEVYDGVSRGLFSTGRDFIYVDGQALSEAEAEDGALRLRGLAWRMVVLPCVDTLPQKAWQNLAQLWRSGGGIIAVGALPVNSEMEFPSPAVQAMSRELFGEGEGAMVRSNEAGGFAVYLGGGQQGLLNECVDAFLAADVTLPKGAPLHATHRLIDGHDVYFVINDSAAEWSGQIALTGNGAGEQWNPRTGDHGPVADANGVALTLEPYGGMLFRFESAAIPAKRKVSTGCLAGLEAVDLQQVGAPQLGKGEFVEGTIDAPSVEGRWTTVAKVMKADVDTFLFLTFACQESVDLGTVEYLVFDVEVPEAQKCGQRLLAILRDERGVEFFQDTQVGLDAAGKVRAYLPLEGFVRAGWVKNADGEIDLSKIREIRIGWGGYKGREGEMITFGTSAPGVCSGKSSL